MRGTATRLSCGLLWMVTHNTATEGIIIQLETDPLTNVYVS
jgi:hypothetical protein